MCSKTIRVVEVFVPCTGMRQLTLFLRTIVGITHKTVHIYAITHTQVHTRTYQNVDR